MMGNSSVEWGINHNTWSCFVQIQTCCLLSLVGSPFLLSLHSFFTALKCQEQIFFKQNCQTWIKLRFIRDIKKILCKVGIGTYEQKQESILIKVCGKKRKGVKRLQSKGKMICRVGKVKAEKKIYYNSKKLFLVCFVSCHHLSLSSSFLSSLIIEK